MSKNLTIKRHHAKLGEIIIDIIAENEINKDFINPSVLNEFAQNETIEMLYGLYGKYMSNDNMTNILGEVMIAYQSQEIPLKSARNSKEEKAELLSYINTQYSKFTKPRQNSNSEYLKVGDNIRVTISLPNNTSPIHSENLSIKKMNSRKVAYLEENFTDEEYRNLGLYTIADEALKSYLAQNEIYTTALEAIDLDGNEFNLMKMYKEKGYQKGSDGYYYRDTDQHTM